MTPYAVTRVQLREALRAALEPLPCVHAMWEAGAAAFSRVDEWSDLDLQVDVDDDRVADTFDVIEKALAALSSIELCYRIPEPAWHGHSQRFYRLRDASPYLVLDLVVMKHSSENKFLEQDIHGQALFLFDRDGVSSPQRLNWSEFNARLRDRLEALRVYFDLFQVFTLKEIHRGNPLEALAYYQGMTLRPLVEALGMLYRPAHYNFHTRYAYIELPAGVVSRLEPLFFVRDIEDIQARRAEAEAWFHEIVREITLDR